MRAEQIKNQFPLLRHSKIAYLDSGATSQKPKCVLQSMQKFYKTSNANAHRGAYALSIKATQILDDARHKVAKFLNAKRDDEIVFTKNATESLNLIAYSYGMQNVGEGDEIVLSIMEHHSMIVPWQMVANKKHAKLKYMYINSDYQIDDAEIESKITTKTKVVGISSVSNVLGTITNYQAIIKKAHSVGAVVIVDISQSIAHMPFDVQNSDADFVAFSAHKMYGPLGVGVLYGKQKLLSSMPPFLMGGDMIEYVYEQTATFADLPNKFEAGTQDVCGIAGLASAIDFINKIGYEKLQARERELCQYAHQKLSNLPFLELYCTKDQTRHSSVFSFNVKNVHPHDVASILDANGVCIRAGNHCAQPLIDFLGVNGTCRASVSVCNTKADIDRLCTALCRVYDVFKNYIK